MIGAAWLGAKAAGKVAGGVLRAIPWQVYAFVAALALIGWYGHLRERQGAEAQLAIDAPKIAALEDRLRLVRESARLAADTDKKAALTQAARMNAAAAAWEKETANAITKRDSVIAGLRADTLRLRSHWQGCARSDARPGTDAGRDQGDAAADIRATGAGDLVRIGADANAQVTYLWGLIESAPRCFKIIP